MSQAAGLRLFDVNPIWQKSLRSRLRMRHVLSWGAVTVTITAFVCLMTYLTMTQQELASPQNAAKAVLPALVVIQAILLMMFGTGAVAAGVAQERDEGLLDYQRMTPMSPTSKILGYLFGLPVREYFLFALTLPFVVVAVWISKFDLLTLLHFYAVFFTSVWVYHMTGLAAGMVAAKPRLASMLSMGLVAALYFVLPNLSRLGITFFEFLTIRPTFFGLLYQELPIEMRPPAEASGIDAFRDVPFFAGVIHPTAYTLLVQGFMLTTLFMVAWRKWRNQSCHVLSKGGALFVYFGVLVFLLASLWAVVSQEDAYRQVFGALDDHLASGPRSPETLEVLLMLSMIIVSVAYLLIVAAVTPSRHTAIEGWRRAKKLGRARLDWNSDAASSVVVSTLMVAGGVGAGALVMMQAWRAGYFERGPSAGSAAIVVLSMVGTAAFVQGLRERSSLRVFGVTVFLLWMIPFFTMMIMLAAFEAFTAGSYVGLACPPVAHGYAIVSLLESLTLVQGVDVSFLPDELEGQGPGLALTGAVGYGAAGALLQVARIRRRRELREIGYEGGAIEAPSDAAAQ
jgi:hypothetical protein